LWENTLLEMKAVDETDLEKAQPTSTS